MKWFCGCIKKNIFTNKYKQNLWNLIFLQLLILATCLKFTQTAHEPGTGVPTFIRSSVESPPQQPIEYLSKYSQKPTFGDTFLPLRSAVESSPALPR